MPLLRFYCVMYTRKIHKREPDWDAAATLVFRAMSFSVAAALLLISVLFVSLLPAHSAELPHDIICKARIADAIDARS